MPIKVTASINNNKENLFDDEITTDQSGIAEVTVSVPSKTNCLQIKVGYLMYAICKHNLYRLK